MDKPIPKHIQECFIIGHHREVTPGEKQQLIEAGKKFKEIKSQPFRFVTDIADILLVQGDGFHC